MRKIPSLFARNYAGNRQVYNHVTPGCEWVINGEGVATKKYDGTCCMVAEGVLYKRLTLKPGRRAPDNFIFCEVDLVTGKKFGWATLAEPPADKWHWEALKYSLLETDGTYELCGPKVQGNAESLSAHVLFKHGEHPLTDAPRTFDELKAYLTGRDIEGIVWHHPNGRMAKTKGRDFGLGRPNHDD